MTRLMQRSRVEILVDLPLVGRTLSLLEDCEISGYTVLPTLSGSGAGGHWTEDRVTEAEGKVMIMVLTTLEKSDRLIEVLTPLLEVYGLVVVRSPAEVIRGDKFD